MVEMLFPTITLISLILILKGVFSMDFKPVIAGVVVTILALALLVMLSCATEPTPTSILRPDKAHICHENSLDNDDDCVEIYEAFKYVG